MRQHRYAVDYRPSARLELFALVQWIARESPQNAALVLDRVVARVESLDTMPGRFPRALSKSKTDREVRYFVESSVRVEYLVGRSTVSVVRVRHAAMNPAK